MTNSTDILLSGDRQTAQFACSHPGYLIQGEQVAKCTEFGKWLSDFPICKGLFVTWIKIRIKKYIE